MGSSGSFFETGNTSLVRSPLVGCVVLQPPNISGISQNYTDAWSVTGPFGETVDTTGTLTQGLQEAINYAVWNGYPLRLMGRAGRKSSIVGLYSTYPPVFFCDSPITFPPMFQQDIDLANSSIIYRAGGNAAAVTIDSCMMSRVRIGGQMVNQGGGTGPALRFKPQSVLPIDPQKVLTSSDFVFGSLGVVSAGSSTSALVEFDCKLASITSNYFRFAEVECQEQYGFGIAVKNAGSVGGTTVFEQNTIDSANIHGFTDTGIIIAGFQIDGVHYFGANARDNVWRIHLRGGSPTAVGINCFGNGNLFHGSINGAEGGLDRGIITTSNDTATGGNENQFFMHVRDNTGAVYVNGGTNNYAIINGTVR